MWKALERDIGTSLKKTLHDFVGDPLLRNAPNVIHMIDVHENASRDEYTVYMTWCAGGTLWRAWNRFNNHELCSILVGACNGLHYLNTRLNLVHYDIKPLNVFVHIDGDGTPSGVIGDIDDVIIRSECLRHRPAVISTPCYGAPFEHCDIRRDQVAMVLTIAEVLSREMWPMYCIPKTKKDSFEVLRGYTAGTPGEDPTYWPCWMYHGYHELVSQRVSGSDIASKLTNREYLIWATIVPLSRKC